MSKVEGSKPNLSRRDVLKAIGLSTAATLTPALARADDNGVQSRRTEVIVVGAGFAGLTAARELVRKWLYWKRVTASVVG